MLGALRFEMTDQDILDAIRQSTVDLGKVNTEAAFIYGARKQLIIEAVRQGIDLQQIAFASKSSVASVRIMATEHDAHDAQRNAKRLGNMKASRDTRRPDSRPQDRPQSRTGGAR